MSTHDLVIRNASLIDGTGTDPRPADVAVSTALGVYAPTTWTLRDMAVDVVGKYVQAQGTGLVFDRFLDRR